MTTTGLTHQIHLPPRLSNDDAVVKLADEEEKSEGGKDASVQPLETPAAVSVKRTSQPIFADEEEKKRMVAQALKRKRDAMKKNNNNNNNNNKNNNNGNLGSGDPPKLKPPTISTLTTNEIFGCEKCCFDREGCFDCLKGPPVRTRYEPEKGVEWLKDIPPCPQYFPTEEEWNNGDPLEYINKIRPEAEKFGLANIVPPKSWQPEFCLPNKEFMRFRTRIQAVNELQNRPAGLGKRARMKEAGGEKVAMASGGRMASAAPTTTAAPPAPSAGRMGGAAPATTNGKNQPSLSLSKTKYQEQKQQRDEYVKKEVEKITKQYGFQSGARHTMETMKRYSDYFKARYFSDAKTGNPVKDISIPEMEREFWRIIEDSEGRNIEVIYGADIATIETGSGMPTNNHKDEEQKKFANNPWNVTKMPYNASSCLSHVERTTGITVPWLYFGMTLSTFCWHVEDHHFYSVNYHHFGDPKVWYCIPAEYSQKFEQLMRTRLPHLFEAQPDLLHSLVTILSPKEIKAAGIPVYRVQQNARSYIITFPYSYHAGFNTGYNCAEAVNFAPVDWLPFGAFATERYVGDKRYQSVAHDQLLLTLTNGCDRVPGWKDTVKKEMDKRVKIEEERREKAKTLCGEIVKMEEFCDFNELDCCICLGDLNWAGVVCECTFRKGRGLIYCLRCVDKGCKCEKEKRKMVVRQTIDELKELVKAKCIPS